MFIFHWIDNKIEEAIARRFPYSTKEDYLLELKQKEHAIGRKIACQSTRGNIAISLGMFADFYPRIRTVDTRRRLARF